MGDKDEAEGLVQWLEESGRALELRVMRAFRRHARVEHSVYYTDPNTGKSREVDVVARFYGPPRENQSHLDVVVECKTGKAGSQWVAFADDFTPARFPASDDAWLTPVRPGAKSRFEEAWDRRPPAADRVNVSSIVTAHDGKDTVHAAVQQLLAAVDGQVNYVRQNEMKIADDFDESTGYSVQWSEIEAGVVGIVMTTVPLYVADLDENNAPRVTAVEIVAVRTDREGPSGLSRLLIAQETALDRLVENFHRVAERL